MTSCVVSKGTPAWEGTQSAL